MPIAARPPTQRAAAHGPELEPEPAVPAAGGDVRRVFDALKGSLAQLQAVALPALEIEARSDGADTPFQAGEGDTPLIRAARCARLSHVKYLLKHNEEAAAAAEAESRRDEVSTDEEESESNDVVDVVIAQRWRRPAADIEARNSQGETALQVAADNPTQEGL